MRVRRGPATVTEYCAREPGTAPPAAATRDEDPEEGSDTCAAHHAGSRPGDPPAVHLGHRPAVGARVRCRLAPREPEPRRRTCPRCSTGADVVVVRILGGRRYWEEGLDTVLASGKPVVALGGEQAPDAEMMELSTVPAGVAGAGAHLPRAGRPGEPRAAARLPVRHRAAHRRGLRTARRAAELGDPRPRPCPDGRADRRRPLLPRPAARAGTPPTSRRCARPSRTPAARPLPVYCASLRQAEPALLQTLRAADAMVVTVLAAGGTKPAGASAGGDDEAWDVAELAALDVPILQGLCLTSQPRHVGGQRRRPLAARRRDPGRRPRVRRPADHRAVLLQGVRRRRALGLRARPRARGPRRRHRRAPRPAAAHPERGQADRADAVGVPDQARPDRQRRRARHPGVARSRCCAAMAEAGYDIGTRTEPASPASPSRTATR